jgi:endothelin-converting enzyme
MAPTLDVRDAGASTCLTPACIHAASEMLWNLAPNYTDIDPCTHFDECKFVQRPGEADRVAV